MDTVFRSSISIRVAVVVSFCAVQIPHLEKLIARIVQYAALKGGYEVRFPRRFPRLIRFDYRIDLMIGRAMKRPLEVALLNQEIIDQ